ncbi:endolytic transglycosylase MltG [Patescibacteria group bacterium]|nr:endolytic transglycosylase MltG [Patescibacteria group bacterium]MBU1705369.1 endolytic transglycosylase MltG [Patescibacteria group bacterium]
MKKLGLLILALLIVGAVMLGSFVWDAYLIAPGPEAQEVEFTIEPGQSVETIAINLKEADLIKGETPFKLYTKWAKAESALQAGIFTLQTGMSYSRLVSELSRAEAAEVQVTIPEGYTLKQIGKAVREQLPQITEAEWLAVTGAETPLRASASVLSTLPEDQGLEGYLFPDTYRFREDADAETVAATMLSTLKRRLAENEIVDLNVLFIDDLTWHEVLTLASIVEKEVRTEESMKNVADIFLKRLRIGMALQADSTVNYLTGGDSPGVSLEDTKIDSPYNTYQRVGLPPGPISNPGLQAIDAVLKPTENNWYYFLTSEEGEVFYAQTFDQHVINKNKYLR